MKARCLVHTPVNRVELREVEVREPGPGEALVETICTAVSPGTELRCLRVSPEGQGYVPGYAIAGRVLRGGPGVDLPEGAAVSVAGTHHAEGLGLQWGGHISHALIRAADAIPIPPGVEMADAALARLAAIAFHGVRLSRPFVGESVAVLGLGVIGQLSARLHRLTGARVVAADRSPARVEVARRAGVEAVVVEGTLQEAFAPVFPEGADVVVDATGVPAVLPEAVEIARALPWDDVPRSGPRYMVQGSYPADFSIPYQDAFAKEITFLLPRNFQRQDAVGTLNMAARGLLAVRDLAALRRPEEAPEVYAALRDPATDMLTAVFTWTA